MIVVDPNRHILERPIELPSWAFDNSGTRFGVFGTPGTARDPFEKISDAAQLHKHTGLAPTVALHIPWDKVSSYSDLRKHAQDNGADTDDPRFLAPDHLPSRASPAGSRNAGSERLRARPGWCA